MTDSARLGQMEACARVMVYVYKTYGCGYYNRPEFCEAFERLARLLGEELNEEDYEAD